MTTANRTGTRKSPGPCANCGEASTGGLAPLSVSRRLCLRCMAIESMKLPAKPQVLTAAPVAIRESKAWAMGADVARDGMLWQHQSLGLSHLEGGDNVGVSTSTASGKSLIFQLWTMYTLEQDPNAVSIILYPTKALANDQLTRWKAAAAQTGIGPDVVRKIDGDVPMREREDAIAKCRIAVMTPDVCHSWLTRKGGNGPVRQFLAQLRLIIIDEAHTYESVLGSNAAYLFRRLTTAAANAGNVSIPQFIAATATIQDAASHLRKLTGHHFTVVGEESNGAPRHERAIHHIPCDETGFSRNQRLAETIISIIDTDPQAQVIAFCDSRQGVEQVVQLVARPETVLSYRAGYLPAERREIEESIRSNVIRAVVATSALELGIDMPDLNYGIVQNLPATRKQFHQRLGRVGRSRPGTFIVLAHSKCFSDHGDTLKTYYDNIVEPSHLYLDNDYVRMQQALCLLNELPRSQRTATVRDLPDHCEWPEGFEESLREAQSRGQGEMARLRNAAQQGLPQVVFSLRSTGEESIHVLPPSDESNRTPEKMGDMSIADAIREAYPGGVYRHRGNSYWADEWARKSDTQQAFIRTSPVGNSTDRTWPILRQVITLMPDDEHIIDGRWNDGPMGCIATMKMTVTDSVEGLSVTERQTGQGGRPAREKVHLYRDLSKSDPRKTRKQREFPTNGILIQINEEWFTGREGEGREARRQIGDALKRHMAYDRSIGLPDIKTSVDNISMATNLGYCMLDNVLVIYDNVYGGLGLVDHLYHEMENYARALLHQQGEADDDERLSPMYAQMFMDWLEQVKEGQQGEPPTPSAGDWWRVARRGTAVVAHCEDENVTVPGTVTAAKWDAGVYYEVETEVGTVNLTDWDISPISAAIDWELWKPSTEKYTELMTH